MTTNITDTEFLADILQGIDKRLDYIAGGTCATYTLEGSYPK